MRVATTLVVLCLALLYANAVPVAPVAAQTSATVMVTVLEDAAVVRGMFSVQGAWAGAPTGSSLAAGTTSEFVLTTKGSNPVRGSLYINTANGNLTVNCQVTPATPSTSGCTTATTGSVTSPDVSVFPRSLPTELAVLVLLCQSGCDGMSKPETHALPAPYGGSDFSAKVCLLNQLTDSTATMYLNYSSTFAGSLAAGHPTSIPFNDVACFTFTNDRSMQFGRVGVEGVLSFQTSAGTVVVYVEVGAYTSPVSSVFFNGELGSLPVYATQVGHSTTNVEFTGIVCYNSGCGMTTTVSSGVPVVSDISAAASLSLYAQNVVSASGPVVAAYASADVGNFSATSPKVGSSIASGSAAGWTMSSPSTTGQVVSQGTWLFTTTAPSTVLLRVAVPAAGPMTWSVYTSGGTVDITADIVNGDPSDVAVIARLCGSGTCADTAGVADLAAPLVEGPYKLTLLVQNQLSDSEGTLSLASSTIFDGTMTSSANSIAYMGIGKYEFTSPASEQPVAVSVALFYTSPAGQASVRVELPKFASPNFASWFNSQLGDVPVTICQIGAAEYLATAAVCYDSSCTPPKC